MTPYDLIGKTIKSVALCVSDRIVLETTEGKFAVECDHMGDVRYFGSFEFKELAPITSVSVEEVYEKDSLKECVITLVIEKLKRVSKIMYSQGSKLEPVEIKRVFSDKEILDYIENNRRKVCDRLELSDSNLFKVYSSDQGFFIEVATYREALSHLMSE